MPYLRENQLHPIRTHRRSLQYEFTTKHHGGDKKASQWLPDLSLDEEFRIFDMADELELEDDHGNLYGLRATDDEIAFLGSWGQQIAYFPAADLQMPWHGYPHYPLDSGPEHRRGQACRPPKSMFRKMQARGILTAQQVKRLLKGDPA